MTYRSRKWIANSVGGALAAAIFALAFIRGDLVTALGAIAALGVLAFLSIV